jgi:hypothetical protein
MLRGMIRKRFLLVCAGALVPSLSLACSVFGDYVRPTNFELVQLADAIVVATAIGEEEEGDTDSIVHFRVSTVLKGSPRKDLNILGAGLGKPLRSDPDDLSDPNREAYQGPCIRRTFAKGKAYVLFLARDEAGTHHQLGYPFTRVNEDHFGPDSLWMQTITSYLDIQNRFSGMKQLAELERVMQQKAAMSSQTSYRQAMDILDHLKSRSPFKPTEFLISTYETLERGEVPKYPLRAPAADEEKSAAQDLTNALFGKTPADSPGDREEQMIFVLTSLVNGDHGAAMPLFERLVARPSVSAETLGLSLRFFAKNGPFDRAFDLMQARALASLPLLSASDAAGLLSDIAEAMRGDPREEGDERWRKSARASATWPELALRLYWYQHNAFGGEPAVAFGEEIRSLPVSDYRSRPELTLARAANYDGDVETWAIAELLNEPQRLAYEAQAEADDAGEQEDPALVPMQALVLAYGEERDAALLKVFCQSAVRRELLIQSLGKWGDDLDEGLLKRMAATPQLTQEQRDTLGKAVAAFYARQQSAAARSGITGGLLDSSDSSYELLEKIAGGKKIEAREIACKR